jgi:hypothetical protein
MLLVKDQVLIVSWPGWWNMREKKYAADEISRIELRSPWGNLTPKRSIATMYIHRRSGPRLRFVLPTPDSRLASHIASKLANKLGCELK